MKKDVDLTPQDWALVFPDKSITSKQVLSGGFSGAAIYKVIVESKEYIVRRSAGHHGKKGLAQEIMINQLASDHDIAPHLYYTNVNRGLKVADFLDNKLSPDHNPKPFRENHEWLEQITRLTRKLHAIEIEDNTITDYEAMSAFNTAYYDVPHQYLTEDQIRILESVANTPWPQGKHVLSHGDLSVANLIFDGTRF